MNPLRMSLLFFLHIIIVLYLSISNANTTPTDIFITDDIITNNIEPIGANISSVMGGTNFAINNLIPNSGFEPIVIRKFVRINRAGSNWFEWDQEGGPGYWNLAWTGYLNGATVRFYRIVNKNNNPLSYHNGDNMADIKGADHVIFLGEANIPTPNSSFPNGGYIANDSRDKDTDNNMERVFIDKDKINLRYGDYAYIFLKTLSMPETISPPDLRKNYRGLNGFFVGSDIHSYQASLVPHPTPIPADFSDKGETCLKVNIQKDGKIRLGQYAYHKYDLNKGQWYSQLTPGAKYRVSAWLRQENLQGNGEVRFIFSHEYKERSQKNPWKVTNSWQHFTYDFIAPPYPVNSGIIFQGLELHGPGTIWIDNLVLYRNDKEHHFRPFTPQVTSLQTMLDVAPEKGNQPAVRFNKLIYHQATIESMMTNYGNTSFKLSWNSGVGSSPKATLLQALNWAYSTGDNKNSRMTPILTCNEEYTEREWLALIEFLGVPFDPELDTKETKPYAYLRYIGRNKNTTTWTDEFREIIIEYGNETWHNGTGGFGWHGWGKPGLVHRGGVEYGLFYKYMIEKTIKNSFFWNQYNLNKKIKFMIGGNYQGNINSYAENAIQQTSTVSYIGHANYVGAKWETDDKANTSFNDNGIQNTLIGLDSRLAELIKTVAKTKTKLSRAGYQYDVIAYEGGPSGYWRNKEKPEIDELYGKSVAMGVAALDTWLFSSQYGFKYQAYHCLSGGKYWTSHTPPEEGGFRPHPAWLLLKMRNKYATGSTMLQSLVKNAPTLEKNDQNIPLISSYTIKNKETYSVFIISKRLGFPQNADKGYTPITLHLPFDKVVSIKRYRLENFNGTPATPGSNNINNLNVVIGEQNISVGNFHPVYVIDEKRGGEAQGVPPGSVTLLVFSTKN